jgi:dihydrofolate reductase
MREIILFIATSQDGFIATRDGSIEWLTTYPLSEEEDGGFQAFYAQIDTILMGRKTFEHVLSLSNGEYPHQDRQTLLFTSNPHYELDPFRVGSRLSVVNGDVVEIGRRLKKEEGTAIWLCGGASIINTYMQAGLIDKLIVTVVPVVLGEGIPLWDQASIACLPQWIESQVRTFDGCTQITYMKEN